MKKYYIVILVFSVVHSQAQQIDKIAFSLAYRYTEKNVLQAGVEYRFGETNSVIIGSSILYTRINRTDKFIPEANINFINNGLMFGISGNQYSLEPRLGISCFNIFFINSGYSVPIHRDKYFKGITFGIQFNIASNNTKFYDKIKIF